MAWPCRFITARRSQHVRFFAEKGLSEELSGARPAADDEDDEGEEIAADLGELDIPGVGDY